MTGYEQLHAKLNETTDILQNAQETVVKAAEALGNAPLVANTALEAAQNAVDIANSCAKCAEDFEFHVDANNGSDEEGDGSEAKPFATLNASFAAEAKLYFPINTVTHILHSDATLSGPLAFPESYWRFIKGTEDFRPKITIEAGFSMSKGFAQFTGIDFIIGEGCGGFFLNCWLTQASVYFMNCSFTGNATTAQIFTYGPLVSVGFSGATTFTGPAKRAIYIYGGGNLVTLSGPTITFNGAFETVMSLCLFSQASTHNNINGNATGKRYDLTYSSTLFTGGRGPNLYPGTEAGTCDATSKYI